LRLNALVTDAAPIERILTHIGEQPQPPPIAPARPGDAQSCSTWVPAQTILGLGVRCFIAAHPPAWDDAPEPVPDWDLLGQPAPELEYDQRIS
jgi:hypothetical protein